MKSNSHWTKVYFTHRSPQGVLSPSGDLTTRGLCMILLDLLHEGNYHPICKVDSTIYSNSDRSFAGRYYCLSEADEVVLREAVFKGLLESRPKDDRGAYINFTDFGLQNSLKGSVPNQWASILGETHDTLLRTASSDADAVCTLMHSFEKDLIRARSFDASDFTYHNVVSILHKMMLDSATAMEHLTRDHKRKIHKKPIDNNCSLFDLYFGPNTQILNSFEQGMFMSVRQENSEYRLGKWHGGYNHLGDYNPLHYGRRSLTRANWLALKIFEVYTEDYTLGKLLNVLRNNEVSHSSFSKRQSLNRMLEIANRNLRGDGDVGDDDARGIHETLVYLGYHVGMLLCIIRCWRAAL